MKTFYMFTIIFLAFPTFVKASCFSEQYPSVYFQSLNGTQAVYEYRIKLFSDFFGDSVFSDDGLFVFYEKDGLQRLWFFDPNHNSAEVYQLPHIQKLPWLNPEVYIEKRNAALARSELVESCRQTVSLDSITLANLWQLKMEKHAFFSNDCITKKNLNSPEFNRVILGFLQHQGSRKQFYFVKFESFDESVPSILETYTKSFDIIEKINDKIVLAGCR